ncbi:MAG: Hsp20/alpha crystallin family protein [Chlorobiaceae bacterium]
MMQTSDSLMGSGMLTVTDGSGWSVGDTLLNKWSTAPFYSLSYPALPPFPAHTWHRDDAIYLDVDLPGIHPATLKVELEDDRILIKAERTSRNGVTAPISLNVAVPVDGDLDKISSTFKNGVLTVTIAFDKTLHREIPVDIQG